ncbi:hypothetical protein BKA82DRAFT_3034663 [Pisolithus tinctorius]|nr:hypothetical protein BKA82DRAFT_3034663 [Pisolithus tinctorius]
MHHSLAATSIAPHHPPSASSSPPYFSISCSSVYIWAPPIPRQLIWKLCSAWVPVHGTILRSFYKERTLGFFLLLSYLSSHFQLVTNLPTSLLTQHVFRFDDSSNAICCAARRCVDCPETRCNAPSLRPNTLDPVYKPIVEYSTHRWDESAL